MRGVRNAALAAGCAAAVGVGGLARGQDPAPPPVPESESVGLGTKRLPAGRCSVAGTISFRADRPFRYRGRLTLESRRRGSKKWLLLVNRRLRQRGIPDSGGRASTRVPAVVSLSGEAGRRIARGHSFRATAVQRLRIDGGLLERTEIRNFLRMKQCELGTPSRLAERSLTAKLRPPGGGKAKGTVTISERGRRRPLLSVRARLPRLPRNEIYELWAYDDPANAVSLGAQLPNSRGRFVGSGPVPSAYRDYAFVDISREKRDRDRTHSGRSVLRGPLPVDR